MLGVVLVAVAVLVGLFVGAREYAPFLFDSRELRLWIRQFGVLAPLVFIGIQTLQVIVAPIPGQAVALVAGYLFGSVPGTVYSFVGVMLGSAIAFSLSKRYGRPFVENVLHEDVLARFDGFVEEVGVIGLIIFVIIPGLPDDAVCFLSGLTKWRLRTFMVLIAVGRFPAYVLTVYAGSELAAGKLIPALGLICLLVVLSVVGYYKQEAVRNTVERLEPRLPF